MNNKEPKWLWRLESIKQDNGLWYDSNGSYCFGIGKLKDCKTKDLPMGYDPRYHVDGKSWWSACSKKEDLLHWYSVEDALTLLESGFVFTRYLAADYIEYEHETVFLKETAIKREVIDIKEVFDESQKTKVLEM